MKRNRCTLEYFPFYLYLVI